MPAPLPTELVKHGILETPGPVCKPSHLALETLQASVVQLQAGVSRLEALAGDHLGSFALAPYFRASAAIMTAASETEAQVATVEELLRRAAGKR